MAKLNDYSGFNQIFRDTLFGVVLSAGGLSTFLPNLLENVSASRDLDTFSALNFFSVIYFLLPIVIFTSYWLVKGFKRISLLRLDVAYKEHLGKVTPFTGWGRYWVLGLMVFKLAPILAFIVDQDSSRDIPVTWLAGWCGLAAVLQLLYTCLYNRSLFKYLLAEDRVVAYVKVLRINALVFGLDLLVGLSLVVFLQPWVFYTNNFLLACVAGVTVYGACVLALSNIAGWVQPTEELVAAVLLLCCVGCCVPGVNLHGISYIPFVALAVLTALSIAAWTLAAKFGKLPGITAKSVTGGVTTVVIFAGLAYGAFWITTRGYTRYNRTYFEERLHAAEQMPVDKLFPFYFYDSLPDLSEADALQIATEVDLYNHRNQQEADSLLTPEFIAKLLPRYNVRTMYFPRYDCLITSKHYRKIMESEKKIKILPQDSIDNFYQGLHEYIQETMYSIYLGNTRGSRLIEQNYELSEYNHPVDFYAMYLEDEREQRNRLRELIKKAEGLQSLRRAMVSSDHQMLRKSYDTTINHLLKEQGRIQDIRNDSTLFKLLTTNAAMASKPVESVIISKQKGKGNPPLSPQQAALENSAKALLYLNSLLLVTERRYEIVYKGAQTIYRSYLVDSQRIGVYTFLATLVIVSLIWWFNYDDERKFGKAEESIGKENLFSVHQVLFVLSLSLFILLIPLMRPIKPENIDPEKPYWMMTLQNWYAPEFTAKITEPDTKAPRANDEPPVGPTDIEPLKNKLDEILKEDRVTNNLLFESNIISNSDKAKYKDHIKSPSP